jgi:hypothetical protein
VANRIERPTREELLRCVQMLEEWATREQQLGIKFFSRLLELACRLAERERATGSIPLTEETTEEKQVRS